MSLTEQQEQQYRDEGYLIMESVIPPERLNRYQAIFDELVERSRSMARSEGGFNLSPDEQGRPIPGRLHKLQGVGVIDERVLELARESEILDRVGPFWDATSTCSARSSIRCWSAERPRPAGTRITITSARTPSGW